MLAASMLLGCQESDSPDSKPELSVDGTEYTMPAEGGSVSVKISSNCYWDVTAEDPDGKPVGWITTNLTKGRGSDVLEITAGANIKTERRVALVKVETPAEGVKGCEITVTQAAGEVALTSGYSFPICQTIDIDNPESRTLANAVITGNECQFKDGMILSCTGAEASTSLECPSHIQPTGGTDADRAIHRSIRFDNFAKGESILISVPVKDALSGDLRLMMGARALPSQRPDGHITGARTERNGTRLTCRTRRLRDRTLYGTTSISQSSRKRRFLPEAPYTSG